MIEVLSDSSQKWKLVLAGCLILLPAVLFYAILWRTAVSIPILDDYAIILDSLNRLTHDHGVLSRFSFVFVNQHNGYKLIFENAVILSQYSVLGQIHLPQLVALGNALALGVFLTVIAMSRVSPNDLSQKIVFLVPVAYLILQLQYASALNFASSSLQHLAVVFFSLLSIYLITHNSDWFFLASDICLAFAISSSPNGFFVVPGAILFLLQSRRWKHLAMLLVLAIAMLGLYLFRYGALGTAGGEGNGGVSLLRSLNAEYALSFLGSSVARFSSVAPAVVLGGVLCCVFALACYRSYFKRNPAVFYSMLFILVNAVAVSGLRSDQGVAQSLASRYRTYSNLFLAFSYMFMIENLFPQLRSRLTRRVIYATALVVSVAFCAVSDLAGARFLQGKKEALTYNYMRQWHGNSTTIEQDPELQTNPALLRQMDKGIFDADVPILRESARLGVYQPPDTP